MPLSDDDKDVKQRAVDNIMKLIHSQLTLEKKQAKMDSKVRPCAQASAPSSEPPPLSAAASTTLLVASHAG